VSKKSPFFTGKQFPVEVCDQLRHHVGKHKALKAKRDAAFEDRDAAVAELNEQRKPHSEEALELKERHSDAVLTIDQLSASMKWHQNQIRELIENPDQTTFKFMLDMEDADGGGEGKKKPKPEPDRSTAVFPAQTPDPKPAKKKSNDPVVPDGEHQHMLAAVAELDLRDDLKSKLVRAELGTVGAVHLFLENKGDLCERANVTPAAAEAIAKAVAIWTKKHNRAELEQSREAQR